MNSNSNKNTEHNFIFVNGASGSGTTLLLKIFSGLKKTIVFGGNYNNILKDDKEFLAIKKELKEITSTLWDRKTEYNDWYKSKCNLSRVINNIDTVRRDIKNIVYKRSAPFFENDRYRPDLFDIVDVFENSKIIILFRDPKASTYSTFRRGYVNKLSFSAKICEEQLTLLNSKLKIIDKKQFLIINYEKFCQDPKPYLIKISKLCNIDFYEINEVARKQNINTENLNRWKRELSDKDISFLSDFFNDRRKKQFDFLYNNS